MKSLASLLFLACVTPASAELVFYWGESKITEVQRPAAEERVRSAAVKYQKKQYADMGVYDFIASPKEYIITFGKEEGIAGYQPSLRVLFADDFLADKPSLLEYITFHEFSHAYDYIKRDEFYETFFGTEDKEKKKILLKKIKDLGNYELQHQRAFVKEDQYMGEMEKKLSEKEYQRLQKVRMVLDELRKNPEKQHEWRSMFEEIYKE